MSELIHEAAKRKELLKSLIRRLEKGEAPEEVRYHLTALLGKLPYSEVVEVEQELLGEGLPEAEVLRLCNLHAEALKGQIAPPPEAAFPAGHPLTTFRKENEAIGWELRALREMFGQVRAEGDPAGDVTETLQGIKGHFNALLDVDKHYKRKENLLFSLLERHNITGPSSVMWAKDDEIRGKLRDAIAVLDSAQTISRGDLASTIDLALEPAVEALDDMITREEDILFPMSRDALTEDEWFEVYEQSVELGFCLYDPQESWQPEKMKGKPARSGGAEAVLPTGTMNLEELTAVLNTIPFDITFVDRNDEVRYFSHGRERIFARNRAIIGRNIRRCHPPKSVHVIEKIIDDFKNGREDRAAFWINMQGRFIHIEYFALRNEQGEYLGVLEVSQDLTEKRKLEGERRLLAYG